MLHVSYMLHKTTTNLTEITNYKYTHNKYHYYYCCFCCCCCCSCRLAIVSKSSECIRYTWIFSVKFFSIHNFYYFLLFFLKKIKIWKHFLYFYLVLWCVGMFVCLLVSVAVCNIFLCECYMMLHFAFIKMYVSFIFSFSYIFLSYYFYFFLIFFYILSNSFKLVCNIYYDVCI